LHHAEEFLYIENARASKIKKEVFLMRKYLEEGYKNLFENKKDKVYETFNKQSELDSVFFLDLYDVNVIDLNYRIMYSKVKSRKDSDFFTEEITRATTNMLNYFLLETANNFFNVYFRESIFANKQVQHDFIKFVSYAFNDDFMETLKPYNSHYYILELYKKMLVAFMNIEENHLYLDYKNSVQEHIKKLSADEKSFHYAKLYGYCTLRLNKDRFDDKFRKESATICREMINYEYFKTSKGKFLSHELYVGYLNNFFNSKDPESIIFLINKCIPLMKKKHSSFYEDLSLSNYHFLKRNYFKALDYLNKLEVPFFPMHFRVKTLLIKTHFHIGNIEQVLSAIEAYIRFLHSDKGIPKWQRNNHENFAKFTKKIIFYTDKKKFDELSYLSNVILKTPDVSYKNWLLDTIEEFLVKHKKQKLLSRL